MTSCLKKSFLKFSFILANSNSSNILKTESWSGFSNLKSLKSYSIGTSRSIVANFFERIPLSELFSIFSLNFPFISCVFCKRFSIEPYWFINFFAVFSPTPGSPGILSTESPIIPKKSMTCIGSLTSNFFWTSGIPHISIPLPILAGLYINMCSETNWAKSLSGVTINTS